jgi:hypothetical protein
MPPEIKRPVPKRPELWEVALYAPIGFAARFRSLMPELVQSGKSQVALVKLVGSTVAKKLSPPSTRSAASPTSIDAGATPAAAVPVAPPFQPSASDDAASDTSTRPTKRTVGSARPVNAAKKRSGASKGALPIASYDTLAASAVVALLPGLTPSGLRAVRDHERSERGRRTILAKIDQLLG